MKTVNINGTDFAYKKISNGYRLFHKGELFAFLVDNRFNEQFIVTASMHEGKAVYMFSTTEQTEKMLGIHGMGYLEGKEWAKATVEKIKSLA